jgi:hypothetical protein
MGVCHGGAVCGGKGMSCRCRLRGRVGVWEGSATEAGGRRGGADVPDPVGGWASPRGQHSSEWRLPKGGGGISGLQRASRRGQQLPKGGGFQRHLAADPVWDRFYLYGRGRVAGVIRFYMIGTLMAPDDPTVVTMFSTNSLTWSPYSLLNTTQWLLPTYVHTHTHTWIDYTF